MTAAYSEDVTSFVFDGIASDLEKALVRFSQRLFSSVDDDATEPSLKARILGLFQHVPVSKFSISSEERVIVNNKYKEKRYDIYVESMDKIPMAYLYE